MQIMDRAKNAVRRFQYNRRADQRPLVDRWIDALRSGGYKQGRHRLRRHGGYCCLGVLTHLYNEKHDALSTNAFLPVDVLRQLQLEEGERCRVRVVDSKAGVFDLATSAGRTLADLNDIERKSFTKIADIIEKDYRPERYRLRQTIKSVKATDRLLKEVADAQRTEKIKVER